MPSNKIPWEDKFAKCPYYIKQDGNRIICEGIVTKTTLHVAFEHGTDKSTFFKNLCCNIKGCVICPIHQMLDKDYANED